MEQAKSVLIELINNYSDVDRLIDIVCKKTDAIFSQKLVNNEMRYWFEYPEGRTEVTVGAEPTKRGAIIALLICLISK